MGLGPLMIDIAGLTLDDEDRQVLQHPLVGGVILFSRNYQNPQQVAALCAEIHALRQPALLIAVDHEGGRVQRFREGFVHLPACAQYGQCYAQQPKQALALAEQGGWLLAAELRAVGVDFSFAPVLDLHHGVSHVIDDRAFHRQAEAVTALAQAMIKGMRSAGMAAVGKHYPGHGAVVADSHHELPVDKRRLADIYAEDLLPFERLIRAGLPALMTAHVVYSQVDSQPASFSRRWLQKILRTELDFQGVIFSDDLNMAGAAVGGDVLGRTRLALAAGCDVALICNNRPAVRAVLAAFGAYQAPASQARLLRLRGRHEETAFSDWTRLHRSAAWQAATQQLASLNLAPELALNDDSLS